MIQKSLNLFEELVSTEYLFLAWQLYRSGKTRRPDVQKFSVNYEKNIFKLQTQLIENTYKPSGYTKFRINDPKPRIINKASVLDRFVHQALFGILYSIYDSKFYCHSYSSRLGKGTHKAVEYFRKVCNKTSKNYTREVWVLKCDIQKYFDSVDHEILKRTLRSSIVDVKFLALLDAVIDSFHFPKTFGKGIPLGNVTSQIFTNIYLNKLDQYIKHTLKFKYYIRYSDDMLFICSSKQSLQIVLSQVKLFLTEHLKLSLHPNKIELRPLKQGVDFLGYVLYPKHTLVRTKTIKRMHRRLRNHLDNFISTNSGESTLLQALNSYLGILGHADTYYEQEYLKNNYTSY